MKTIEEIREELKIICQAGYLSNPSLPDLAEAVGTQIEDILSIVIGEEDVGVTPIGDIIKHPITIRDAIERVR